MIFVRGKGGKECLVLMMLFVLEVVEVYCFVCLLYLFKFVEVRFCVEKFLFFLVMFKQGYMMWEWFVQFLCEFVLEVGFDVMKIFLYVLWYVFVMYLFSCGVDLCSVQVLLGYVDVFMIQIYMYVFDEWLK